MAIVDLYLLSLGREIMRLSEVRKIILENINQLKYDFERPPEKSGIVKIKNISTTINAIENLSQLSFLCSSIEKVKALEYIYTARMPLIIVSDRDNDIFKKALEELHAQCSTIVSLVDLTIKPIEGNIISIELAETTNISDVKKLITNLDEAFSQISNLTNYKGTVRFAGLESGSSLINLFVDTVKESGYLVLVLTMIKIAYSAVQDYKIYDQRYKGMLIQNQANQAKADLLSAMVSSFTRQTIEKEDWKLEPEELGRFIEATIKLGKSIDDGNKITALLTAPTEKQSELGKEIKQVSTQLEKLKLLSPPENIPEQSANGIDLEN